MRLLLVLALLLTPAAMAATPWPKQLQELQTKVDAATADLATLNQRIKQQREVQAGSIAAMGRATRTLLRLGQWPTPLLNSHNLLSPGPNAAPLLRLTQRYTLQQTQHYSHQLAGYLRLRAEAGQQLQTLQALTASLATGKTRLSRQQQQALAEARLSATQLEALLQDRPGTPSPTPVPSSKLQPVAGQAMPGGDGTNYLATPGAPVVAVVAGKVVYSGPFRNLGGLVISQGPHNVYAVYAGLGSLAVTLDDPLSPGTPLGAMPATPARPRLYFELRRDGHSLAFTR